MRPAASMTSESDCRWLEVSPDYYGRLQQFECAVPSDGFFLGAKKKHGKYYREYQLEVQNTIRGFRKCDPLRQWAHICVSAGSDGNDRILSFVWFGIINGRKTDGDGTYMVGYIARERSARGCRFGDFTLKHALRVMKLDCAQSGRDDAIGVRVDPDNQESMALFLRNGFHDTGEDPNEPSYHRLIRFGFDDV